MRIKVIMLNVNALDSARKKRYLTGKDSAENFVIILRAFSALTYASEAAKREAKGRPMKRKLYFVSIESETAGECEGVFDADGTLLDFWADNDASWRNEYFAPFMARLGFDCETVHSGWRADALEKAACEAWCLG